MEFALGTLGWSPDQFWNSTFYEISCAYVGYSKANGLGRYETKPNGWTEAALDQFREEVEEMKRRFPD